MDRYKHLMVGLARTAADAGLIRYAAMVARLGTAHEIRLVHVLPSSTEATVHAHDRVLCELEAEVRPHLSDLPDSTRVCFDVLKGPLFDRLLAVAAEQEADLMLVGHGRANPGQRALARRLAMKAPCSVWMVPEGAAPQLRRFLVPIDFSDYAADTMQVATSLARLADHPEVLALHVFFNEASVSYEGYEEVLRGQEAAAFERFLAPVKCHGVKVTPLFVEGAQPGHVINRVAAEQGADLILMASRGRSRSAAILLGSVTEETLMEARVPVLVVKHFGAQLGLLQVLLDRSFRQKRTPRFD
jgi:nucleotide-binding universal stress UspA family protein